MTSIFIGNLSPMADENAITEYVASVARVDSVTVARFRGGDSKGYAIMHMVSEQDATEAINQLNGATFMDQRLTVREDRGPSTSQGGGGAAAGGGGGGGRAALNNLSLHVSNLSWDTTDDGLHGFFSEFGASSAEVMVHDDSGRSKGWGLVHFATADDAASAMDQLQGEDLDGRFVRIKIDGSGRPAFDGPRNERAPRQRNNRRRERAPREERVENSSGLNVFVGNLAWAVDDDMLGDLVDQYGPTKSEVMYGDQGTSRGYAIVSFAEPQEADACVNGLNGLEFEGRRIQARLDRFG